MKIGVIAHVRHAIKEPFAGGLEMHTQYLCRRLRARGHQVSLFAARGSEDAGLETLCGTVPLDAAAFAREHKIYLRLMQALRSRSFDIIHNNSLHYLPVAMAGALPMPMLTTLHTPVFWELEGSLRLSARSRPCFAAVSTTIGQAWQPVVRVDEVIVNGIDLERFAFAAVADVQPYVIWYGRIVPEKGLHLAIAAARLAGLQLRIAGPVLDRDYFAAKIQPWLDHQIRYLGHLAHAELAAAIGGARAFLCTPLWDEPYGLVVVEALACGTPVAAFARGAVPALLDSCCGMLVEPDDVPGLATAALAVQHCARAACRARAETIGDGRQMLDGYEHLYAAMIVRHAALPRTDLHPSRLSSIEPTVTALADLYRDELPTMTCRLPASASAIP